MSKNTLSSYNLKIVKQKNGSTINSVGHTKSNILVLSYITLPYKKGGWVGGWYCYQSAPSLEAKSEKSYHTVPMPNSQISLLELPLTERESWHKLLVAKAQN